MQYDGPQTIYLQTIRRQLKEQARRRATDMSTQNNHLFTKHVQNQ